MAIAARALGSSLAQVYNHFTVTLLSNLLAFVLSLPILLLIGIVAFPTHSWSLLPLGGTLLVGVLPNPATAGVQSVARDLAHGDYLDLRTQWAQLRRYALPALKCWLAALAVTLVILANFIFYSRTSLPIAVPLRVLWLFVLWLWIAVHVWVFPLLLDQDIKTIRAIYRNAFVLLFARPVVTMLTAFVWLAGLAFMSSTGLTTIIGLALGATIQQNAFSRIVPTFASTES